QHLYEGTERDPVDRVDDAVLGLVAPDARRQAEAEFLDGDAAQTSGNEVTELMNEHHDAEDGDEPEDVHGRGLRRDHSEWLRGCCLFTVIGRHKARAAWRASGGAGALRPLPTPA